MSAFSPDGSRVKEAPRLALAASLTAIAGSVDAIGFLRLGHFFVSFMSGNTTQFAAALARDESREASAAAALIATFFVGTMCGRAVRRGAGGYGRAVVLFVEALLLTGAALTRTPLVLAGGLMAFAMGLQNAVIHRAAGAKTGLTYITGTLVSLAEACADATLGDGPLAAAVPPFCLWLGFLGGATAGAVLFGRVGVHALAAPVMALFGLALAAASSRRLRVDAPD